MKSQTVATIGGGTLLSVLPLFVLLCFSIGIWSILDEGLDAHIVLTMTCIAVGGVAIHLASNSQKNWLRIDTIFILGFLVVNFQWPIMYAVSDYVPTYSFQAVSIERSGNVAVALATMSLLAWMIGYKLVPANRFQSRIDMISGSHKIAAMLAVSIAAFSLFAGSAFFSRSIYTKASTDVYMTVGGVSSYLLVMVETVAIIAVAYISYDRMVSARMRPRLRPPDLISAKNVIIVLLFLYCLIFLIGGDRGQVVAILVGGALAVAARARPVALWEFLGLVAAGFVVFTLIGIARSAIDASSMQVASRFGYWGISTNLAQSVVTLTQAVTIVEGREGLFLGSLWISQIVGLIPFLQGAVISMTGLAIHDISSAMYITRYTFGSNIHTGLGTSFVADLYMNFGVPGTILFSALYGVVSMKMSTWLRGDHGFVSYFAAIAFGSLIFYVTRSSILFQVKPIVWGIGLLILLITVRRVR